ncbi:MAG: DHA2 family efflux MFS transporter permease subunit [Ferrovibrionaceae bacterium]
MSRPKLTALIVACALFMENLDGTIIATALPQIAQSLGTSPIRLSLAITSYMLSLAVLIPVSGWFADRYGARRVFRAAILVFTCGSLLCAMSDSLWQLTAARIVQGLGGALMVPVGRLVLLRSVEKSELVQAMAYLTVPALIGPVIGPPIGGFIVTFWSWRWIFLLNLPIGLIGFWLVTRFIEDAREPDPPPLDIVGAVLSAIGLSGLMLGFEILGRDGEDTAVALALLAAGAAGAAAFLWHARRHPNPVLDFTLMRIPTFAIAVGGAFVFRVGIGALPFLLPLMLQLGFGMSALSSGLLTFASAVGALAMKMTAKPILKRFGFRAVLTVNALLCGLFIVGYGLFRPDTPHTVVIALLLAGGFFRSLQFTGTNTLSFADVPPERMSRASSMTSTLQQLSLSLGVAVGAALLHLTLAWRGAEHLGPTDFTPAFIAVGLISGLSTLAFLRLKPEDGADVSGHRRQITPPASGG